MIKAIITDFDGTVVNTYLANFLAYQKAMLLINRNITLEDYERCFGLRFSELMNAWNVVEPEERATVKEAKKRFYPDYFKYVSKNETLLKFIRDAKKADPELKVCLATTASMDNLRNMMNVIDLGIDFDVILTGEDVKISKPHPEVYRKALAALNVNPEDALVFEDSEIGMLAAENAGITNIIKVKIQ